MASRLDSSAFSVRVLIKNTSKYIIAVFSCRLSAVVIIVVVVAIGAFLYKACRVSLVE